MTLFQAPKPGAGRRTSQGPIRNRALARVTSAVATVALAAALMIPAPAYAQDQTLNFRDADVRSIIDDISMMTGKTFIVDPRVRANMTIISRDAIERDEVFDLFLTALRVYGFAAVPTPTGAYKIVPDEAAVQDYTVFGTTAAQGDQLVTDIIRLNFVDSLTALNTVKPLVHRQGRAIAHAQHNFLLLVDYATNIQRLRDVVAAIDRDNSEVLMMTLENASAEEISETLKKVRTAGGAERGAVDPSFKAIPVISSNTLILKGAPETIGEMSRIVRDLDSRNASKGDIRVINLRYSDAEAMVPVLEQVSRSLAEANASRSAGGSGGGGAAGPAGGPSRASIAFHQGTNALVISAEPAMQKTLEGVIRQLDVPRPQVLVEAIIVEVSDNAARNLGLQYVLSGSSGSNVPFTATNFSSTAPNVLAATGALLGEDELGGNTDLTSGLAASAVDSLLGLNGFVGGFGGQTSNGTIFGVILNALETDNDSNILSTPSVMTLDNQSARFVSGQEIPISTGEVLGQANQNPFRTIERQEVGIKLEVKPQISEGDDIQLYIKQEVSSIFGPAGPTLGDLITNTREIETTVTVADGEIVVLGGLMEEEEQLRVDKVPLLGDIPVLGRAFRTEAKSVEKSNLMVFIRPTIVRNAKDARGVTDRKFDVLRSQGLLTNENGQSGLDYMINDATGTNDQR